MATEWKSRLRPHPSSCDGTLELGRIAGIFGVRGEVRLFLENRESTLMHDGLEVVLIAEDGSAFEAKIRTRPGAGGRVLGQIDGIDRRELAAEMIGVRIVVEAEALPAPADGEFYLNEIVGFEVREGDRRLGTVAFVHATGPVEVLELDDGSYVPCTTEHVEGIDTDDGVVWLMEGGCSSTS